MILDRINNMNIYSFEKRSSMWEPEFFSREFNLEWIEISNDKLIISDKLIFIATTNPIEWTEFLLKSKPRSVILFNLSNETKEKSHYTILNDFDSILHVFLCFPPNNMKLLPLKILLQSIFEFPTLPFEKGFYYHARKALLKSLEMRSMILKYSWTYLPVGYSNRFVTELKLSGKLSQNHKTSLLHKFLIIEKRNDFSDKSVFFNGRPNGWYRRKLLEKYARKTGFKINLTSKTGEPNNENSTSHVLGMFENSFALIPPGNISNLSFRYYEAIICGAIPIHQGGYLQDWQNLPSYIDKMPIFAKLTHMGIYKKFLKLDVNQLLSIRKSYEKQFMDEVQAIQQKIEDLVKNTK